MTTPIDESKDLDGSSQDLRNVSSSLSDLFSALNADVEISRFIIEKVEEGTSIDFAFKALIKTNNKKDKP